MENMKQPYLFVASSAICYTQ